MDKMFYELISKLPVATQMVEAVALPTRLTKSPGIGSSCMVSITVARGISYFLLLRSKITIPIFCYFVFVLIGVVARASEPFVDLDSPAHREGYLASLLINEIPFPGERGYKSVADSQAAALAILWVLESRINRIPQGYSREAVSGVSHGDIIAVITGTPGKRQCEGFYLNSAGVPVFDQRVAERIEYLTKIANSGNAPGRFASLLLFARDLARGYLKSGASGNDPYADLSVIQGVAVTGGAYSWMTDLHRYHPGGNFITITNQYYGSLGGNRFFTLRKEPR